MKPSDTELPARDNERPDAWWYPVYAAVVVVTVIVISTLWFFWQHFSR